MSQVDPDEPDWSEVVRVMREARAKSRGYADYWEWAIDRPRAELRAAEVLQNFLVISGEQTSGQLLNVSRDPPDVLLTTIGGRRIGIEVTELVDSDAVKRHRHRKKRNESIEYDWAEWTPTSIATELSRLVDVKDGKLAKAIRSYDELLLAIVTDEGMIDETIAREAVALCRPVARHIRRAFLLVSYQPQSNVAVYPDSCPVLPVSLSR